MASFEKGMGVLAERFRSPMHPDAQKGYYAILSSELGTEEFRVAVMLAFRHAQFWPSPQQLINYARPQQDLETLAAKAWNDLLAVGTKTPAHGTNWLKDKVAELGVYSLAAFVAIGANGRLKTMNPDTVEFIRRDFVREWKAAAQKSEREDEIENARSSLRLPRTRHPSLPPAKPEPIASVVTKATLGVTR